MHLQKVILKKLGKIKYFVGVMKVTDENGRIRTPIRLSKVRIPGSGSAPKCHGSSTLPDSEGVLADVCPGILGHDALHLVFLSQACETILLSHQTVAVSICSTTGKPTRSFATERVSLDSV
jgi:hypothetical protein